MTRLVILIASLLLSTISSPVENTTPRATSDDLVHVIHASENIYQIFRTLDPSWQSGLGCFQNKGLEFFKTTFCDKAKIKESHPIGSLRRAMDDLINPIKERIQKKENLDATDNEFLKWLGVEVANCQREESDPYHANKKLRGSIINSKNLSEKFRALAGREIPVSDGTTLNQDQAVLLMTNPLFPFHRSGWSPHRFEVDYGGLLDLSFSILTQEEDQRIKAAYSNLSRKADLLRSDLFKKNPDLFYYAAVDHYMDYRNHKDFDINENWSRLGLDESGPSPEILNKIKILEQEKKLRAAAQEILTAFPPGEVSLIDDDGVPLQEMDFENLGFKSLSVFGFVPQKKPKSPPYSLEPTRTKNGQIVSWEIKKRETLPKVKVSEYFSAHGFFPADTAQLLALNKTQERRMLEEEKGIAKALLSDPATIAKVREITEEAQRLIEWSDRIQQKINASVKQFLGGQDSSLQHGCEGLRDRLISQYAANKWVTGLYNDPQVKAKTEENIKTAATWVNAAIQGSILSDHSKGIIKKRIDDVKLQSDDVTPDDLLTNFKQANEVYEKFKAHPGFSSDEALRESVELFSGRTDVSGNIAVNASYQHPPRHTIEIMAGYMIPSAQNEHRLQTLHTFAHELGHAIDPFVGGGTALYAMSEESSVEINKVRTCLQGDRTNQFNIAEDFADLIGNEAIGFYLASNQDVSDSQRLQYLQDLLSASCNPQNIFLDEHGKSSDRAEITLNNPKVKNAFMETIEYSQDRSKQDCGAKLWAR